MPENKKNKIQLPSWAQYVFVGLEIALMVILVVISFVAMRTASAGGGTGFIKILIGNTFLFFMVIVLPLIILFLFNVYLLIRMMNESSNKQFQTMTKEELMEEARRQAREEIQREMEKNKE